MSAAIEVASRAKKEIEELLIDMFAGNHEDNEISLGLLLAGDDRIQVQLKVTRNLCDFLDDEGEDDE